MNDDFKVVYADDDMTREPICLIYQGEEYVWNGAFQVDMSVVKEMDINELPFDLQIQPIAEIFSEDTIRLAEYRITNTEEGIEVMIEDVQNRKYWEFPGVSMDRYFENKAELIQESELFTLEHYDNEEHKFLEFAFSFNIPHPSSMNEAISIIEGKLGELEQKLMTKLKVPKKVREEYCLYTKANQVV